MNYHDKSKEELIELLLSFEKQIQENTNESNIIPNFLYTSDIDELIKTESEYRDKSALLTNLIINLKEGILLENSNRQIVITNQLFCEMFNIPVEPEFLIGSDCSQSAEQSKMFFDNPEKFITDINEILNERKPVFNDVLSLVDGRFFERDYIPTFIEGKYSGHLWKYRDITNRIHSEEKLKNNEENLRKILYSQNEGIGEVNQHEIFVFVNPAANKIFETESLLGMSLFDFLNSKEIEKIQNQTLNRKNYISNVYELEISTQKGNVKYLSISSEPKIDELGEYEGAYAVFSDITERKNAQRDLKLSEERYRKDLLLLNSIFESPVDIIVFSLDVNFCYTAFTKYHAQTMKIIWGVDIQLGMNMLNIITKLEDREKAKRNFERVLADNYFVLTEEYGEENLHRTYYDNFYSPVKNNTFEIIGISVFVIDVTERMQANKRLEISENRFRQVVEQSEEVVWEVNSDGLYTYVSPIAEQVYGYKAEQLVGKMNFYDLHPENKREEIKNAAFEVFKRNERFRNFINEIKKPNGVNVVLLTNGIPVFYENGDLMGYRGVDIDITKQVEAEKELKKFRTISDEANYGAFIASLDGNFEYVNSAFATMLGWESDDLLKMNFRMLHRLEDKKRVEKIENLIKKKGGFAAEELLHVRKDGSVFPTLISTKLIYDKQKKPLYLSGTLIDITERKHVEQELRKLSQAINQSPVNVIITNAEGIIEFVNPAFEKVTGYTIDMVKGKNTRILKSGQTKDSVYVDLWKTIKSGNVWETEWLNKRKSGEVYWEYISISPVFDNKGIITNFLAIKQDITQKKNYEKQILDLNQNLESKIKQRTIQLEKSNFNLTVEIAERKRIEDALKESELKYRSVVENIQEIIFQTDNEGKWLFLNQSWEHVTGFSVEESLGKLFLDFVHPDDRALNLELFEPLIRREKGVCRHETRYLKKDGGYCWIDVFARLGVNDANEVIGAYGSLRDITEQKRAEEFENEMLLLSAQLTGIKLSEIDIALHTTLTRIAKFLNADRSYIFEIHDTGDLMSNTYEWCNDGISAEIDNLKDLPIEIFPEWMKSMQLHRNVIIPSVADLPAEWINEKEILEPQGIKSLIALPLLYENNFIGFVGLDSVTNYRQYSQSEINVLMVWSSMLSTLIMNKRNESLLEISRQNFKTFFNTIDDFLWVLDENGRIIHINNTVVDRLGYSPEELDAKSVLMVHPENRREEAGKIVTEMLQGKSTFCPVPLVTKDGRHIPVETRVKYGLWNGLPTIFGVSKDISKIQLSEQKFSTAFQSSSALMAISDYYTGIYVDVNNTFVETVEYDYQEIVGRTNMELCVFEDEGLRALIIDSLDKNIPVRKLEVSIKSKSGNKHIVLLSADTIYVGDVRCLLTVSIDISDRKRAEQEMHKAQLEAEKANVAKSEFLSRMSHELRTPMNSILGFAQILELGDLNTGQKKSVNHILKSGRHLLNLINEVLDISRIEAGRLSLNIETIEVNSILDEMSDIIRPLALERGVKINKIEIPTKLFVKSDKQSLNQILLNLLHNAVKYNKPSGLVSISAKKIISNDSNNSFIRISITDTGYGITDEDITKIFIPFERIGATNSGIEGTGLGLAVVKKLVETMGGTLGVDSKPGIGSTFWIQLSADNPDTSTKNEENEMVNNIDSIKSKAKVLYIEDNLSNIELVEEIFSIQLPDVQLVSTINGCNVVDLAIEHSPNVILLDMNLPDIQGDEVLLLLQGNDLTKNIPVIILSADAMQNQIDRMLLAGSKKYLTKPLDISEFMKIISEFL